MNKKFFKIMLCTAVILAVSVTFVACAPAFKDAPQGLSKDERAFKEIKDKRMDAQAEGYDAYIYKSGEEAFCFRLKSPSKVEESKKYPLIIFLHGSGDWGTDNSSHMYRSLIESVNKYVDEETFVFMPQGIKNYSWDKTSGKYKGMDEIYNKALDEIINKYAVDTNRIYITGMSMGGYGTFYQAYSNPEKYAAMAPICGYYPQDVFADLSIVKTMPIYLGHSRTDNVVDFMQSEDMYNRLLQAGATDVKNLWLDEYKHDMTQPFYDRAEFWQWLMSKSK